MPKKEKLGRRLRHGFRGAVAKLLSWILPFGILRDRRYFALWQKRGIHVVKADYRSPIPDTRELSDAVFMRTTDLIGVDMNDGEQLALMNAIADTCKPEYDAFPREATGKPHEFFLENGNFTSIDAEMLYGMVRHFKPNRLVEVGSGYSTLLTAQALLKNEEEGHSCEFLAIEPHPRDMISGEIPGLTQLAIEKVESISLAEFEVLGRDDILFLDTSHVVRIGGDLQYEFLEILPRLKPGVLVHIHDIFLPSSYPKYWVMEHNRFWNEQYLLQAFMAYNEHFEVLWAGQYMVQNHPNALRKAFKAFDEGYGMGAGSFWIRRTR